eukprot:CAMPEP_0204343292 /NCGR_PEP_ID=MMETSP0469-20131031/24798_1 /ASSEMBLY_ACC=CAM_ASM_000384 /TAXON_ID=2969 /ORGANISM="Oxyrrhis marina" /LENGTH=281 /DNA_ID=CAMNT_0051328369 /DNA_START=66 /DNA_END=911 /DNA_ORIENTATION=+
MPISVSKQSLVTSTLDEFLSVLLEQVESPPRSESEFLQLWMEWQKTLENHGRPTVKCPICTVRYYLRCRGVVAKNGTLGWPATLRPLTRAHPATPSPAVEATKSPVEAKSEMTTRIARVVAALQAAGGVATLSFIGGSSWSKDDRAAVGRFSMFVTAWPEMFRLIDTVLHLAPGLLNADPLQTATIAMAARAANTTADSPSFTPDCADDGKASESASTVADYEQLTDFTASGDSASECSEPPAARAYWQEATAERAYWQQASAAEYWRSYAAVDYNGGGYQ